MKHTKHWFTLIEILLGILLFSAVIIAWLQAFFAINIGRAKLIESTNITKDIVYFSEKLFDEIKKWGTIDFEEYFNRKVVGTQTLSGHYSGSTWFGNYGKWWIPGTTNYGSGFYFCRSGSGIDMGVSANNPNGWCYTQWTSTGFSATNTWDPFWAALWDPQRYGQYTFQFIDYNSNFNADLNNSWISVPWDQNSDGFIRWDDDDEYIGYGPTAFTWGENVREIYLISGDRKSRTLFRWNWFQDPNAPVTETCDGTNSNFWSWCLGTIEMLRLTWEDWGIDHSGSWAGSFDGIIDTWAIDPLFGTGETHPAMVAWSTSHNYWQKIFPDSISVTDFRVYMYPNIDTKLAWKDDTASTNFNPYMRLSITLEPSWKKRIQIKGKAPKFTINTTINLTDYFSQ